MIPWLNIGLIAAFFAALVAGYVEFKHSVELEVKAQELSANIVAQQKQNDDNLKAISDEKDAAITRATTLAQQLAEVNNGKNANVDAVLSNTVIWLRKQPDSYTEQTTSSGIDKGHPKSCHTLLTTKVIAEYILNQYSALQQCRSQLYELRQLNDSQPDGN